MANFLAYFDLLGYKKFIENNSAEYLYSRTDHFGRNIEMALALDHPPVISEKRGVAIPDISHSTLNCLTFSDTVILWTQSNTLQDFEEILRVAHKYNQFNVTLDFPSRGCIVFGDIWYKPFDADNLRGGRYMLNMIYGKALVDAHEKAEAMSWAGCMLDSSAITYAQSIGNIDQLLKDYTMWYDIPFKIRKDGKDEEIKLSGYALRLTYGSILISEHMEKNIASAFIKDNKGNIDGRIKVIFDNTIEFLKAHKIKFPFYYKVTTTETGNVMEQVFGKLTEDYTHIIIKAKHNAQQITYNLEIVQFDRDRSDRKFLDAEMISSEFFEEQYNKAIES
jgi:hypothetical protein